MLLLGLLAALAVATTAVSAPSKAPPPLAGALAGTTPAAPSSAASPFGDWLTALPYPQTIVRYAFAQDGENLYVVGGVSNGTRVNTARRYNATTNTWTSLANIPVASEGPCGAYWNGKLYVQEGDTGNTFNIYDIATNTWSAGAPRTGGPPHGYGCAAAAHNNKVYVIGGGAAAQTSLQIYDIPTNTWSQGPPAPAGVFLSGNRDMGSLFYIAGGFGVAPPTNSNATMRLDMATNTWTSGPTFTPQRADFALANAGNILFAIGGDANGGAFFNSTNLVDALDTASWPGGSWGGAAPNLPLPNRQANQAGFFSTGRSGGEIWSTGGLNGATFQFLDQHLYRVEGGQPPPPPPPPPPAPPHYVITTQTGQAIVPGTTNIGSACDDCITGVTIPFPVFIYGQSFTAVGVDSNGKLHFPTGQSVFSNTCLPMADADHSFFPYWDDLRTDTAGAGIWTVTTGSAPNRTFYIEWRNVGYFSGGGTANFEAVFHENSQIIRTIYGAVSQGTTSATIGVQHPQVFDQYACNGTGGTISPGLQVTYTPPLPPPPPPPPVPPPPPPPPPVPPPPPPPPPLPPPPPPPPVPPPPRCRVPNVIGLRLATARARIRARRCRVGTIRRVRAPRRRVGRVVRQSPRGGAVRRVGFRVNLWVGRRR